MSALGKCDCPFLLTTLWMGGRIIHLIDRGKLRGLKFPTYWFEPSSQGLFMLSIAFGQAKYYVASEGNSEAKAELLQKIGSNPRLAAGAVRLDVRKPWLFVVRERETASSRTGAGGVARDENSELPVWRGEQDYFRTKIMELDKPIWTPERERARREMAEMSV